MTVLALWAIITCSTNIVELNIVMCSLKAWGTVAMHLWKLKPNRLFSGVKIKNCLAGFNFLGEESD